MPIQPQLLGKLWSQKLLHIRGEVAQGIPQCQLQKESSEVQQGWELRAKHPVASIMGHSSPLGFAPALLRNLWSHPETASFLPWANLQCHLLHEAFPKGLAHWRPGCLTLGKDQTGSCPEACGYSGRWRIQGSENTPSRSSQALCTSAKKHYQCPAWQVTSGYTCSSGTEILPDVGGPA